MRQTRHQTRTTQNQSIAKLSWQIFECPTLFFFNFSTSLAVFAQHGKSSCLILAFCLSNFHRITLLLGPPGCGKTTLLKVLSGILHEPLKVPCFPYTSNRYKYRYGVKTKLSCNLCVTNFLHSSASIANRWQGKFHTTGTSWMSSSLRKLLLT